MSNKNIIDKVGEIMDKNIKGVQYTIYGLAGLGLCIAFRSTRPFKKFQKAYDVPQTFFDKKIQLHGRIVNVKPSGTKPILLIDHYPLIPILRTRSNLLPVQISSIDVNPNGMIWMDTMVKNSEVNFIPIGRNLKQDCLEAIIYKKDMDIGQHLVKIGFAVAGEFDLKLNKDPVYKKYYKNLLSSEKVAESKRNGIWSEQAPSFWQRIQMQVPRLFRLPV